MKSSLTARKSATNVFRALLLLMVLAGGAFVAHGQVPVPISISGNVYDDGDSGAINGTPISMVNSNQLYVILINNNGNRVVATATVTAVTGAYALTGGFADTSYAIALTSIPATVGATFPFVTLPTNWEPTAEGTTATGDGVPDLKVAFNVNNAIVINFGIDQLPVGNGFMVTTSNFGGYDANGNVILPAAALSGTDLEDGNYVNGFPGRSVHLLEATGGVLIYNNDTITAQSVGPNSLKRNFDISLLRFSLRPGTVHQFPYATVDNAGKPEIAPNIVTIQTPLPIKLISFTGTAAGPDNILYWQTATETGNSYFDVERSEDGVHFTVIGSIDSKGEGGTSRQTLNYEYREYAVNNTAHQPYLYRLNQVDLAGGRSTYSNIIRISGKDGGSVMQLSTYPNPSTGRLSLDMATGTNTNDKLSVAVVSMAGAVVLARSFEAVAGRLSTVLDLSAFPAGTYYVQLKSDTAPTQTQQVVLLPH